MDENPLQRLFWWKDSSPPSPQRIAAQVMVLGSLDDIHRVRELYGAQIFEEVLANPPQGLFDAKSWVFWHKKLKHRIIPPLPRQLVSWASS
jgi:hypothetical protein